MKTVLSTYLEILHISFTRYYSDKLFCEHPYHNSMYGLSKMLLMYKIKNYGVFVENKDLAELSVPFIAHINHDFAVVKYVDSSRVNYIWRDKNISISIKEFQRIWSGYALVGKPDEESNEPEYSKHRKYEVLESLGYFSLLFFSLLWLIMSCRENWEELSFMHSLLLLMCVIGLIVSCLLIQKQIKKSSEYVDKICSLFKEGECNNVLESKAAKLGGVLSWSEIGFCYFITTPLLLIFHPQFISYIIWISWLALPYTFWSIWYQYWVIRQWCPLCLSVVLVLWGMAAIGIVSNVWRLEIIKLNDLTEIVSFYLLILGIVHIFTRIYSRAKQLKSVTYELNSLKASKEVFGSLLKLQPYYEINEDISCVYWGNPNAKLRIIVLSNPHCNPCAELHQRIETLLDEVSDKIYLQYIFSSFNKDLEKSARFLIAVFRHETREEAARIFHAWFAGKKYSSETYMSQFPYDTETAEIIEEENRHRAWQQKSRLTVTPTILVNGYLLPDNYKLEDLKNFVDISE